MPSKVVIILFLSIYADYMTEIERRFNDHMALRNIYDADPLRHNDDEYRHQIILLV